MSRKESIEAMLDPAEEPAKGGRRPKYPFGDLVLNGKFTVDSTLNRVSASACQYARLHPGVKFKCRTMFNNHIEVERVQ